MTRVESIQQVEGNLLRTYDPNRADWSKAFPQLEPRDRPRAVQLGMTIHEFVEYRNALRKDYQTMLVWPRGDALLRAWMVPGCDATTAEGWRNKRS